MTNELAFRRLAFAIGLTVAATAAHAQEPSPAPASGVNYALPGEGEPEAPPPARRARSSSMDIRPYLEVAQVVSAELDGGDTLTYTSLAAGVDGTIQTRRVSVAISYRYQRNIEWDDDVGDTDIHSGIAQASVQVVPGALQFDAGAIATRTGGEGRALGVTDRDASVEVYGAYAGPSLSTQAGPVAVTGSYRLGYVAIDDDIENDGLREDLDSTVTHSATASVGMAPGRLPVGWTVGAGYARADSSGEFDHESEAVYVRGDVVVPVSPTLALTAGVGYENIEASQNAVAVDANGNPIITPDGDVIVDPTLPRELTYDLDGIIYDAGIIWRPSARTELQARVGHRYDGTTFVGSLAHQFSANTGMSAVVYDSVETFGNLLISDISNLPDEFEVNRDPLTGGLGGCVFGGEPGQGVCLDRSLQSIRGNTFRLRGASISFSGNRGLWSWGVGAGYSHRRYGDTDDAVLVALGGASDESFGVSGNVSRQLSRESQVSFDAYASWFDTDEPDFDSVFGTGATVSYSRQLLLQRLRLLVALGLYHTDDGTFDSTIASALAGLRYTF